MKMLNKQHKLVFFFFSQKWLGIKKKLIKYFYLNKFHYSIKKIQKNLFYFNFKKNWTFCVIIEKNCQ